MFWECSGVLYGHFLGMCLRQQQKKRSLTTKVILLVSFFSIFIGALVFAGWIDFSIFWGDSTQKYSLWPSETTSDSLNCSRGHSRAQTCPGNYPTLYDPLNLSRSSNNSCPEYFRWIHEDLRPWKETGITKEMIEKGVGAAHFRLVILNGKAYVKKYIQSYQTRDKFTLWGILQLLRRYPGRLPDLELIFDCNDGPGIQSVDFQGPGPPPIFSYCSDEWSLDIVFPDWSYWGWAETNIKPWGDVLNDIKEGNKKTKWNDRVPYAYWKGNPKVAPTRLDLLNCKHNWNTHLYIQNWGKESKVGYKHSKLEDQCTHRYKIYIEGRGWSVSEKYILACDSMTLYVKPRYYDFFIRGMLPLQHYWPIRDDNKCPSLKFAVEWGNNHTQEAQTIGEAASNFIQEDLKMEYVYDYMFHLLSEYAKLLKFKPMVPPGAVELCLETTACLAKGVRKKFMVESLVKSPSDSSPCTMLPPYDPNGLKSFIERKDNSTRQVEIWENEYWENLKKQH